MRVSSSAADLEPRVLASRCSSWMREIQAFADLAAPFSAGADFVQVGLQAGDFLGHVDAGWQRPWPRSARAPGPPGDATASRPGPFFPALQEALALLFHQLRHQGPACWASQRSCCQVGSMVGQAFAFRARAQQCPRPAHSPVPGCGRPSPARWRRHPATGAATSATLSGRGVGQPGGWCPARR